MLLRALLLAALVIAGCSAEEPRMHSDVTPDRHYEFDDYFTEADLPEIQTLVKSRTVEPILEYKAISPASVKVRCEFTDHRGLGLHFVLTRRNGRWCEEDCGGWGTICRHEDLFGELPADALAAIPPVQP